ncbi:ribonuclease III domain-containing protein [Apiosordaria backusii]|uniref:Ribonuclease III domain-containing protein n=1 Tax=Apiosordaria backusii TaxID=314023 RepID=A0AA40ELW1_9PEZI|nr:ribonuclease III domain-containing protein [Apiosordaria backusii]
MPKRKNPDTAKQPPTIQDTTKRERAPKRQKSSPSSSSPPSSSSDFSPLTLCTKWTTKELTLSKSTLPPLPPILDPTLETAALTHSGCKKNAQDLSYERLEWIGDVYLELIASELVYSTFSTIPEGEMSRRRELLIRNSTLSAFSVRYGLDKRANFPEEFQLAGRPKGSTANAKRKEKALADIFEAYVGAIIRSDPKNGYRNAVNWLKALWGPLLEQEVKVEEGGGRLIDKETNPKVRLEQLIGASHVRIEYRDLPGTGQRFVDKQPQFGIGVFFTGWGEEGVLLGEGWDFGKKGAGHKAAERACEHPVLTRLVERKRAFKGARAIAREGEERKGEGGEDGGVIKVQRGV